MTEKNQILLQSVGGHLGKATTVSPQILRHRDFEYKSRGLGKNPSVAKIAKSILDQDEYFHTLYDADQELINQALVKAARICCGKRKIDFTQLSTIQRKFITHYRCYMCGLIPLYHIDPLHTRRTRCRKCGHSIPFKSNGKYGKLRKEIAFELTKETGRSELDAMSK